MLILPASKWRNGDQLVDPTGATYSPDSPPEIIKDDEVLFSALMYGYENRHRIGVTVLSSLQISAEDLGPPGTFEERMAKADVYGSPTFAQGQQPGMEGYTDRVETAMMNYGRPLLQPFCTVVWRGMEQSATLGNLQALGQGMQSMFEGIDLASLDVGADATGVSDVENDAFAARVHLMNHLTWSTVANALDQARQLDRDDHVDVLLDEGLGGGMGATRVLGALGVQASFQDLSLGNWPAYYFDGAIAIENAIATGKIAT